MLASRDAGLCASGSLLCMHSPLNYVLPAHSAFISSSFERSLGKFFPPARDRCGDDPRPPQGALGFDAPALLLSFVFRASRSRSSCPGCFDELPSALILSQSLTTHLQVCNLLLIIHFMRRAG